MHYSIDPKSGNRLSLLGFGCMRFPRSLGQIDMKKTETLVVKAVEAGVNYFDTAYVYFGSEPALGDILHKNHLREKVYLATKLPLMKCHAYVDFDRLFDTQLEHLHTDYIDYYLMHNLSSLSFWKELCVLGIEKWIAEKKQTGRIRQIGFSFHGTQDEFIALLDAYEWDFCQIQYNYVNIHYQAGRTGLLRAAEKGMPVVVMEPLLGGKLANGLPPKAAKLFQSVNAALSPAAWALRWLWNQKQVSVVLSGMNGMAQLEENIALASEATPEMLSQQEEAIYQDVVEAFNESDRVPCTGCNYCMPCPQGVNIPGSFAAYNMSYAVGMFSGIQQYVTGLGSFSKKKDQSPGRCVQCGQCEKRCPQQIPIASALKDVHKRMEPLWFRSVKYVMTRQRAK